MDFNNKPEQGFGGDFSNDNIFDNNQTFDNTNSFDNNQSFGSNDATNSAPTYNAPNTAPGNGVYTPNPAPANNTYNNTYSGGNGYYNNPTPPGDFDRFNSFGGQKETPVSMGEWMWSYLVLCIPCVGLIMMFVWAFGSGAKRSKSNFCKAMLIWALIGTVLTVVLYGLMFAGIIAASDYDSYYYGFIQNVIATI